MHSVLEKMLSDGSVIFPVYRLRCQSVHKISVPPHCLGSLSCIAFHLFILIYCCSHGYRDTSLSLRGINPRLSSVEPDLGAPLTINIVVQWVVLKPRTPPSQQ